MQFVWQNLDMKIIAIVTTLSVLALGAPQLNLEQLFNNPSLVELPQPVQPLNDPLPQPRLPNQLDLALIPKGFENGRGEPPSEPYDLPEVL